MRRTSRHGAHAPAAGPGRGNGRPTKAGSWLGRSNSGLTVAGTAPDLHRLPFEPPPSDPRLWAAPWSLPLLGTGATGCQIAPRPIMNGLMNAHQTRLAVLITAIVAAAALRLVPHPPNFTPIGAMALFSGAYLGRRALAFV